jgi:Xaa-Pro dipeptidase
VYPHQIERLTEVLEREHLHALVATSPANVRYVTGFSSMVQALFQTTQFAVWSRRGAALVVPAIDVPLIISEGIGVDHVVPFGDFVAAPGRGVEADRIAALYERRAASVPEALAIALDAIDAGTGRIGLDEGSLIPQTWDLVMARLGPGRVVPAAALFGWARRVKSPYEIECLERALHIAEEALNAVIQMLKPGVTEREAVAVFESEVLKRDGMTYPSIIAMGERAAIPAPWPTDRALRPGDLVRFDVGCVYKGFCSNVGRTGVMGEPDRRQQTVFDAVQAGLEAGLAAVAPGVPAERVFEVAIAATRAGGLPEFRRHHVGHGIGLDHDEPPRLTAGVTTPLEMGEVLRIEVPFYQHGWAGVNVKDTVLVTRREGHVMNRSLRGLVVLD